MSQDDVYDSASKEKALYPQELSPQELSRGRVVMGIIFYPRGGSAHTTRGLARALTGQGWDVTLISGSVSSPDGKQDSPGDARAFFRGVDVRPVDFTAALSAADPLRADPPLHPSYEDRPGAPDRVFASVDDATYEHLVSAWMAALRDAGAERADVLHLHHLTPLNEAAHRLAPHVPVLGHIHGTELLMLEAIEAGPPASWRYTDVWAARLRRWAAACEQLLIASPTQVPRASRALGVSPERFTVVPNGFDPTLFHPRTIDRAPLWRRLLVEEPRGWRPEFPPNSVTYTVGQLAPFASGPVILYVGRFTEVKRVPLLIAAYQRAQASFARPAPLALVGGFPGEWEGEHPWETIQRLGARDVFLAGWHTHDELPDIFAASDIIVLPSVREQFGQSLVEGMACGLPAIAVTAGHGPDEIVTSGASGWIVPPDDEHALTAALIEAVNDAEERRRRGVVAAASVYARYAWPALGERLTQVYLTLLDRR
jgi:glycosyltransferase involved in cell wall biosynthesis